MNLFFIVLMITRIWRLRADIALTAGEYNVQGIKKKRQKDG